LQWRRSAAPELIAREDAHVTEIRCEIDDPVALITLDRPDKLNALTYPILAEFRAAVERAASFPRLGS
jgi:enoyl-CoA hydratase/carnithine racemase